jgi:hypothetical protein
VEKPETLFRLLMDSTEVGNRTYYWLQPAHRPQQRINGVHEAINLPIRKKPEKSTKKSRWRA